MYVPYFDDDDNAIIVYDAHGSDCYCCWHGL